MYLIYIVRAVLVLLLTIVSGTLVMFNAVLPGDKWFRFVSRRIWGPGLLAIAGTKLIFRNLEDIYPHKPAIYISNHLSHYDIPAVFTALPVTLHFIAKKELRQIPFLGWAMQAVGMIFVDRKNRQRAIESLNQAGQLIKAGKNVISFPEGTRSRTGTLQRFKKGVFVMAQKAGVDIVPVGIYRSNQVLEPGKFAIRSGTITVTSGERISAEWIANHSLEELLTRANEEVRQLAGANAEAADPHQIMGNS